VLVAADAPSKDRCRSPWPRARSSQSLAVPSSCHLERARAVSSGHRRSAGRQADLTCDLRGYLFVLVEVMGRYLNPSDQGERLRELLAIVPSGPKAAVPRTPRRVFRRLEPAQVDRVVDSYLCGATLKEVAQQFRIHRTTVSQLLEQRGIQRRYAPLSPEQVAAAGELHTAGMSLVTTGNVLNVNQSTVWHALRDRGIALRRPWERGA
jgi:hypothetical protein